MIAFGEGRRAVDDIEQPALDMVDEFGGLRVRPQGVRSDDRDARPGPAQRDLVGDALDARTAGDEAILILALGAEARRRHPMAAILARKAVDGAALARPCGPVRALVAVAGGSSDGRRFDAPSRKRGVEGR